jgi:hypothetical protein
MTIDNNDNGVGWATGTSVCGFVNGSPRVTRAQYLFILYYQGHACVKSAKWIAYECSLLLGSIVGSCSARSKAGPTAHVGMCVQLLCIPVA